MFSRQTITELISVIERMSTNDLERMFHVFGLGHEIHPTYGRKTNADKGNLLLNQILYPSKKGPYTGDMATDMLQYKINHYYRYIDDKLGPTTYNYGPVIPYENKFANEYKSLSHFLKHDGFIVYGREIRKLLPEEFEEAKTESELSRMLDNFGFDVAKEHLARGRRNLGAGSWSSANSEFRNFMEGLLVGITQKLLPNNPCTKAPQAIQLLGKTINPPFLSAHLNEIEHEKFNHPFIESVWKRMHPEGSHFGLSDEDDAMFRFQLVVVLGYYLLNRLEDRLKML